MPFWCRADWPPRPGDKVFNAALPSRLVWRVTAVTQMHHGWEGYEAQLETPGHPDSTGERPVMRRGAVSLPLLWSDYAYFERTTEA